MSCRKNCGKSDCRECSKNIAGPRGLRGPTGATGPTGTGGQGPTGPTGPCCTGPTGAGTNNFIQSEFGQFVFGAPIPIGVPTIVASTSLNFPVPSWAFVNATFSYFASPNNADPTFRLIIDGTAYQIARDSTINQGSGAGSLQHRIFLNVGVHNFQLQVETATPIVLLNATVYAQETLT